MADLGAIGQVRRDSYEYTYDPLTYAGGGIYNPTRQDAVISGEARTAGVLTQLVEIHVIWRPTMQSVKRTFSDSGGLYSFTGLAASTTNYVIYFKDPPGGTVYNDIVYALIDTTP